MRWLLLLIGCALVACGDDSSPETDLGVDAASDPVDAFEAADAAADAGCTLPAAQVVSFTTDDGLMLEADHYPVATGSPAAVLLHMIPPSNTRANYPRSFIEALYCRGITVLNVDRRGAGGSEGDAVDAYEGPDGVLDAKGAVEWLLAGELAPDETRIGVVGASNGTTTLLDFTVFAEMARTVEEPRGVVLLSGGGYTTNQNEISDSAIGPNALFVYPSGEAAWNESVAASAPTTWRFEEISPGAHGTGLFTAAPETEALVADYLAEVL